MTAERGGYSMVTPSERDADSSGIAVEGQCVMIDEVRGLESTKEYLAILLHQESKIYPSKFDYLSPLLAITSKDADPVSESWRRKLCEWSYEVVDHFSFDREVVSIALDYLDRSVAKWNQQTETPITKRDFQLLAVTSLYIAIKIHGETDCADGPRRKLKIDAFYELSRKQFDVELIEKTERQILAALNWNVNPPTSLKYIATLLALCPKWSAPNSISHSSVLGAVYDVARYLSELSICQSDFSFNTNTSLVAYSAVLCAVEALFATYPLPYEVRVAFFRNIEEATGFVVSNAEVLCVCDKLKKLCPNMFEGGELPIEFREGMADLCEEASFEDGKTSPVCVMDAQQDPASRRKRSREDEAWLPIHRPI